MDTIEIVGQLIAVGTKWENDTHLEIYIPDQRSETGMATIYIPCTKDHAVEFGKVLYQNVVIVVQPMTGGNDELR